MFQVFFDRYLTSTVRFLEILSRLNEALGPLVVSVRARFIELSSRLLARLDICALVFIRMYPSLIEQIKPSVFDKI